MQIARGQHWHKLDLTSYDSARKHVLVQHIIVNRSINYVNRNNRVKCQHLPGTGTRARGNWPSGFELSIFALKIEHRPRINARMDLFSGWLLLNDHFSLLYFANQHKSRTFYTIFHYFVAFFTLPWATPNSMNFPVFPYHREIVGLVYTFSHFGTVQYLHFIQNSDFPHFVCRSCPGGSFRNNQRDDFKSLNCKVAMLELETHLGTYALSVSCSAQNHRYFNWS